MPIVASPANVTKEVFETSPVEVTQVEKPMMTYVDKNAVTVKDRAYDLSVNQVAILEITFQNEQGNAYDLTGHPINHFKATVYESALHGFVSDVSVAYKVQEEGILNISINKNATKTPGVYRLVIQLFNDDDRTQLIHENSCLLYIASPVMSGPPTLLEIRLQLRDSSPEENSLLDGLTFTDEELAIATMRPIQYFNETDPDVGVYFNTSNFPSRYYWTEGIIAQLFRILEEYNRKNHLAYNSGGLSVDDRNREANYAQASDKHWQLFVDWVKRKKVKINIANGFAVVGSYYSRRY